MAGPYFYGFDPGEAEARLRHVRTSPDPSPPAIHRLTDVVALPGTAGLYDMEGRRIDDAVSGRHATETGAGGMGRVDREAEARAHVTSIASPKL